MSRIVLGHQTALTMEEEKLIIRHKTFCTDGHHLDQEVMIPFNHLDLMRFIASAGRSKVLKIIYDLGWMV